ncbi:cobalamin-binding protein [Peribacillus butanolivorans]|uniref:Cobalamin-binding protein n=1 Tax=Peribacillus butanolivorans TaxID=421767 RepID=A0AAX0S1J6_9BACI|nr:cobalamin-binding protein [Peribacillus butanolivorans]KRF67145.1 ABC transporter substrate-binding protein [Bacillus sp. Soil768D1]MCO0597692.1 cobalamin-binding protein [Peribacillus butanolivorans]MED3690097.1 cobalamin-binding protein [Peribacillus butanolivorans]PEJ32591.1 cobalamin-binding protein [Peribacillus butanolivorans]QNU02913.1 cobalamin-binding protein [Peribacillus butanolivorans]
MKIISLCPSNTELCTYLGIEEQLIAIDDYSDWPESIQHLPKVGPDLSINIELVESLKPDLVLASLSVPGMEKNIEGLKERNLPYIIFNPQSLEDIAQDLLTLGKAIHAKDIAEEQAAKFRATILQYKTIADKIETKPSLYWEWWPNPLFSPGGVNWLTEISRLAGGYNLFEEIDMASIQVPSEEIQTKNPDHICLAWVGVPLRKVKPELVKKRKGWAEIKAVRDNNIHIMEEPLFCRPSPRLLDGLSKLAMTLHPEAYSGIR